MISDPVNSCWRSSPLELSHVNSSRYKFRQTPACATFSKPISQAAPEWKQTITRQGRLRIVRCRCTGRSSRRQDLPKFSICWRKRGLSGRCVKEGEACRAISSSSRLQHSALLPGSSEKLSELHGLSALWNQATILHNETIVARYLRFETLK